MQARWSLVCAAAAIAALGACETAPSEPLAGVADSIIGGKLDTTHKGVVSVLKLVQVGGGQSGYYSACTGTLLTQNLVLTARHCVAELSTSDGSVECATTKFEGTQAASSFMISIEANVGEESLNPFRVSQVWVPDTGSAVCGNDIALMMLSGSGVSAAAATPIEPRLASAVKADETFAAIGYGLQDPSDDVGKTSGHRMAVTNATVSCQGSACSTPLIEDDEFIAESPVCSGDSGGPALDSAGRVAGVTSRGDADCTIGIYSSVASWSDFIITKTLEAATSGNYTPPAWAGDTAPDPTAGGAGGSDTSSAGSATSGAATGGKASSGGSASAGKSGSSASGGSSSGGTSNGTPLGKSCSGQCDDGYKCWAETGMPPGICVPACSASQTSCPTDYACDTTLNACIKPTQKTAKDSGGCSVGGAHAPNSGALGAWLGLSLLAFQLTRRRKLSRRAA